MQPAYFVGKASQFFHPKNGLTLLCVSVGAAQQSLFRLTILVAGLRIAFGT